MEKKKNILDYISQSTLDIVLDVYVDDFPDICLAINDLDENIVVFRNFHPICSRFHRANKETEKICLDCNKHITDYLQFNDYIEYKCGNGLVDIAFPIMNNHERIGTFYIGQIFIEGDVTPLNFFHEHAQKYGFDTETYINTAKQTKTLNRQQINELVGRIKSDILALINID